MEAILLGIVALLIVSIGRTGRVRVPSRRRDRSVVADLRVGFDEVMRSPLFRLIVLAYVLLSILFFSVTYPFMQAAAASFPTEADLATAIGLLSAAVTATSFVVSLALGNRVYARFGVAGAALLLPLVYLAGFGLWLVQFSFATAALVRFGQQVTQRGLSNAAWSAFYNVLPAERRAQVLAFIDGVPGQIGMITSGLLLLGAGRLFAATQVFWLGAVTALACTIVVLAMRRRYGASLLRTLRSGLGEQVLEGGPGLARLTDEPQVAEALRAALRAPDPAVRRMAVTLLARAPTPTSAEALIVALDDVDPGVRIAALDACASFAQDQRAEERVIARLADRDDLVRAAAVRAVAWTRRAGLAELLEPMAADPSPPVRAAVAVALDGRDPAPGRADRTARLLADPSMDVREAAVTALAAAAPGAGPTIDALATNLVGTLDDDSTRVRRTSAALLAGRPTVEQHLLDRLATGSPRAQEAVLLALAGHSGHAHDPVVDRSLVARDVAAGPTGVRFRLLQTIRRFALDQLSSEGREPQVRRAHAEAYLALAEQAAWNLPGADQPRWLDRLALDHANLCSAVRWSIDAGEVELALRFVTSLWRYWQFDGHLAEGHDLADAVLRCPERMRRPRPGSGRSPPRAPSRTGAASPQKRCDCTTSSWSWRPAWATCPPRPMPCSTAPTAGSSTTISPAPSGSSTTPRSDISPWATSAARHARNGRERRSS